VTNLRVPATSLGSPRITVEQSGKNNIFFGITAGGARLEIIATTYHLTIFKTHIFSLYSHLRIYVSILPPLYTRYIWTSSSRCLRAIRGAPENEDPVNSKIHSEAMIERIW
jgi:hypothetical protein